MGVYIKGMEMPTSCHECVAGYGGCCFVAPAEADGICPDHGRADFCPLVPVPPHGDLVDRDEQIERAWRLNLSTRELIEEMLKSAPTIIPAEEGE